MRYPISFLWFPMVLLVLSNGCTPSVHIQSLGLENDSLLHMVQKSATHTLHAVSNDSISIQYLGCGGLYIEKGETAILFDPFFSNPDQSSVFKSTLWSKWKIGSDSGKVAEGLGAIVKNFPNAAIKTKAIIVSHGHYDHLLDVPAVFKEWGKRAAVYANSSSINTCYHVIDHGQLFNLDGMPAASSGAPILTLPAGNKQIRVYLFKSKHNPHLAKGIKFYSGGMKEPFSAYTQPYQYAGINHWKEGQMYSFIVDVTGEKDSVHFRAFIQQSSCSPEFGFPSSTVLNLKKSADLAILCVASHQFSPAYPTEIINRLNPKTAMWIHWENFFGPWEKDSLTVRNTSIPDFFAKDALHKKVSTYLPYPKGTLKIKF